MIDILVTGAAGFVGQHLVKHLRQQGRQLTEITRENGDITEAATWDKMPKAKTVVHLAARSFVPDSWTDVAGFMKCNVAGVVEALNYCKKQGAHLVYISSYLYGAPDILPIPESAEIAVNNPYALTKKFAEDTCRFYSDSFGVPVTILRPFNVYGEGQSQLFLIPSLITQVTTQTPIHVKDLEPKRDYLYVNDLVSAIVKAVDYTEPFDIFNIGSGASYSVKELIDIVQTHAGTNLPVQSDDVRRKNEVMDTVADVSRAKSKLGWEPQWTLSAGIKDILSRRSH